MSAYNPFNSAADRQTDITESLLKIHAFSEQNAHQIHLPAPLYHASIYANLTQLSPEKGQGFGVWMQGNLKEAAHFAVCRSFDILTGKPYEGTAPSIYEMETSFKKIAIFPNESALYAFSIDGKNRPVDFSFHQMRDALSQDGYDGIYLLAEKTISSISAETIQIKREMNAIPLYQELVLPSLIQKLGRDPFPFAYE